jgi:hypothetical protein
MQQEHIILLYIIPMLLVAIQRWIIETVSKRELPLNERELFAAIFLPLWNWYMAGQFLYLIHRMKIRIIPTIDVDFFPSIQFLPNIQYVFNAGIIITLPFFGVITISPKEVE